MSQTSLGVPVVQLEWMSRQSEKFRDRFVDAALLQELERKLDLWRSSFKKEEATSQSSPWPLPLTFTYTSSGEFLVSR